MRVRVLGREAITEYCGSVSSWVISDVFVSRFHARRFSVIIDRNEIQPYMLLDIKRLRYFDLFKRSSRNCPIYEKKQNSVSSPTPPANP